LTTVYSGTEFKQRGRRRPNTTQPRARPIKAAFGKENKKTMTQPAAAIDYNDNMGAVDIGDQLRSYSGYDHRFRRGGWQSISWSFLLEVALVNSYLLQLRGQPSWQRYKNQVEWRQRLVDDICKTYEKQGSSRQRFRAGDEFTPISQHNHVNREKRARCGACQGQQVGLARSRRPLTELGGNSLNSRKAANMTPMGCDKCDVAICIKPNCWDLYHRPILRAANVPFIYGNLIGYNPCILSLCHTALKGIKDLFFHFFFYNFKKIKIKKGIIFSLALALYYAL
jgi:hypothetical protein